MTLRAQYHGYPWLIHRLTYARTNHENLHVRGYKEEGTTTTPFDMAVKLTDHARYIREFDQDLPEIGEWAWSSPASTWGGHTEADHG